MYEDVDKILLPWLKKYGLHIFTKSRGEETRSFYVVDDSGETYLVFISPPDNQTNKIYVHFGIRRKKKSESKSEIYETFLPKLEDALEATYNQIISWIKEAGHTRTPVL